MKTIAIFTFVLCCSFLVGGSPRKTKDSKFDGPGARIIGGVPASHGEFPYIVQIKLSGTNRHHGGGVIVNANHIITTAYYIQSSVAYSIVAGENNLNVDEGSEQTRLVSEIIYHPDYNLATYENDIAILKLATPLSLNFYVRAATLPGPEDEVHGNLTIAGWGTTTTGGVYPDVLHKIDVPFVDRDTCQDIYGSRVIFENMICAGEQGKDWCSGDGGGPLQSSNGVVYGLASTGSGCGSVPSIYTSLSHHARWINLNT